MGNQKKDTRKNSEYPITKIEPLTANSTFSDNGVRKPKPKTFLGKLKKKFAKKSNIAHISYKSLNDDKATVVCPTGEPPGNPSVSV